MLANYTYRIVDLVLGTYRLDHVFLDMLLSELRAVYHATLVLASVCYIWWASV